MIGCIGADMDDRAVEHAIFLEGICRKFQLHSLILAHKAHILVFHVDLGLKRFIMWNQRHQYRSRRYHRSDGMGRQILDHTTLGCP